MHAWKSSDKKRDAAAEGMSAVMMQPAAPAANSRPK